MPLKLLLDKYFLPPSLFPPTETEGSGSGEITGRLVGALLYTVQDGHICDPCCQDRPSPHLHRTDSEFANRGHMP